MKKTSTGQIRIIGGQWRSRKLLFPTTASLRPTPDSVRETLFNWLQSDIPGSKCLDLFAGSGALGFEAASRGAARVKLVEKNTLVVQQLRKNIALLNASSQIQVEQRTAISLLEQDQEQYDIVFADPPFDPDLLAETCSAIASCKAIHDKTLLYLESARSPEPLPIPSSWHIIRQKARGRVQSTLIQTIAK
ncbi:MAG: 16S rRNA (guanine(966)-N(2))-methyltransferase RsmD [Acidiferrobacterales bacterium]|nr:16S rRNA (guanine(966)-N(2))-methyltransferase RsmD [Acidiferrobacterales bacterium]